MHYRPNIWADSTIRYNKTSNVRCRQIDGTNMDMNTRTIVARRTDKVIANTTNPIAVEVIQDRRNILHTRTTSINTVIITTMRVILTAVITTTLTLLVVLILSGLEVTISASIPTTWSGCAAGCHYFYLNTPRPRTFSPNRQDRDR
jgi:hypothetical protein